MRASIFAFARVNKTNTCFIIKSLNTRSQSNGKGF